MANAQKRSGFVRVFTLMLSGGLLTTLVVYGSTTAGCNNNESPAHIAADPAAESARNPAQAEQKPASDHALEVGNGYMGASKTAPLFSPRAKSPPSNAPAANAPPNTNANAKP